MELHFQRPNLQLGYLDEAVLEQKGGTKELQTAERVPVPRTVLGSVSVAVNIQHSIYQHRHLPKL